MHWVTGFLNTTFGHSSSHHTSLQLAHWISYMTLYIKLGADIAAEATHTSPINNTQRMRVIRARRG